MLLSTTSRKEVVISLFSQEMCDRTRGNGLKLCQRMFSLDIKNNVFTERWPVIGKGSPVSGGITVPGSIDNASGFGIWKYVYW